MCTSIFSSPCFQFFYPEIVGLQQVQVAPITEESFYEETVCEETVCAPAPKVRAHFYKGRRREEGEC